jgi:GNAT superfamily N-acetyltransferase
MARPSYYVETPDGKKVQLDVPENASAEQIRTLAARALKQRFPETKYARPALSPETTQSLLPEAARGELKADDSALSKVSGGIQGALAGLGVDERYAAHIGNRATSALNDLTPVGDVVTLSDARDAWNSGNYLGAIGRGALAGIGLIPGVGDVAAGAAKAMFLGRRAKNADLDAMGRAMEMRWAGEDPKKIWNETGWFQGADNKWRFEVPDDALRVNEEAIDAAARAGNAAPFDRAIEHPELRAAYDPTRSISVGRETDPSLRGSWMNETRQLKLDTDQGVARQRSTAAHELQHFVQGQEGFARGGMVGTIPARDVDPAITRMEDQLRAIKEQQTAIAEQHYARGALPSRDPQWLALKDQFDTLAKQRDEIARTAGYEGYRRLAGEVEARNVQTRLDMTPGQRLEYAPWETEDVPREDQFVIWHGDQPQGALGGLGDFIRGNTDYADSVGVDMALAPRDPTGALGNPDDAVAVELTDLYARETGKGGGTKAMQRLIEDADARGLNLYLKPEQPRNVEFYQRFGFERDKKGFMVRRPFEPKPLDFDPEDYPEGYAEAMGWK